MSCSLSPDLDVKDKDVRSRSIPTLKSLAKLLENHLYWRLFIVKFATLVMSVTGIFLEYHEIFENFLTEHLRVTAVNFSVSENQKLQKLITGFQSWIKH